MRKKSSFYHTRWHKVGLNPQRAADLLGVTVEQIEQWDIEGAPLMAERFLLIWDRKYINLPGWDGWHFSRGVLKFKNSQWRPETILNNRNAIERANELEQELRALKTWKGISRLIGFKLRASLGLRFATG